MRLLIVCSGNALNGESSDISQLQPFIYEQALKLMELGIEIDFFLINGKGLIGYLKNYKKLVMTLRKKYDLIHAHYGLSGVIANLQNKIPVITTFHGSDINLGYLRIISYFPLLKSVQSIFVSQGQLNKVFFKSKITIIPCGVDLNVFYPFANRASYFKSDSFKHKKKILFSASFSNKIKNYPLARAALLNLNSDNIELIELFNKSRKEVCNLLNTSDLLLLTSLSEGSPMVIKEAMACNCPIVSTDVGDVREVFGDTIGCYIASFDPKDVAEKIKLALEFTDANLCTNGRERIIKMGLDSEHIAERIAEVYRKCLLP